MQFWVVILRAAHGLLIIERLSCHPGNAASAMIAPEPFAVLMSRLAAGDDRAAAEVFNSFARKILTLARCRLHAALRRKVDPEDVLQSVFRSFFVRQRKGEFAIENWQHLWSILMVMTLRKCCRRVEHYQAACRDVRREVALPPVDEARAALNLMAAGPTPAEAAVLADLVDQLLSGLSAADRQIVLDHLQGYTIYEASVRSGCAARTVRRVLDRARKRLRRLNDKAQQEPENRGQQGPRSNRPHPKAPPGSAN
jgi:RNA polymerase sigma-70 factor, ECF subfamily